MKHLVSKKPMHSNILQIPRVTIFEANSGLLNAPFFSGELEIVLRQGSKGRLPAARIRANNAGR
jgi:hypothetical protein